MHENSPASRIRSGWHRLLLSSQSEGGLRLTTSVGLANEPLIVALCTPRNGCRKEGCCSSSWLRLRA